MMTLEEKKATLNRVMQAAMGAGMCRTVKQFAELLGVNKAGLSSALNGDPKNCTDSLVRKTLAWAAANGLEGDAPAPKPAAPSVTIPGETVRLFENLSETVRSQQQTIAQLVQAVTAGNAGAYLATQKNFQQVEP